MEPEPEPTTPEPGVAVVTGAAHGIGLAVAQRMAARGLAVAAVDSDDATLAAAPLPPDALRISADIAGDPGEWLDPVVERLGPPTVLVNNVARMDGRSFLELPLDEARRSLDVTLFGNWATTRAVVDHMIHHRIRGSIVFTLSLHARRVRLCPDYSVAKAGLVMLIAELANELGPFGIRVNGVSPGAIDTWSDRIPDPDELRERSAALVPLGRLGTPDDVARAVDFLTDPAVSSYVTGANLTVDGGLDQFNWLHHLYGGSARNERERHDPEAPAGGMLRP